MMTPVDIIILAAGAGKRMLSHQAKVLHLLAGKPLLQHVYETANSLAPQNIHTVIGHQADAVQTAMAEASNIRWVLQTQQLGTGHAVLQAVEQCQTPNEKPILILYGDMPLITQESLQRLLQAQNSRGGVTLLTTRVSNPTGLGRIVRGPDGSVLKIVEEKDADAATRAISEVNTGIFCLNLGLLRQWLPKLGNQNAQQEYYLTDLVAMAYQESCSITAVELTDPIEAQGVNDPWQLSQAERYWQLQNSKKLILQGVKIADPARFDVRGSLQLGKNISIDINVVCEGSVELGDNCQIGPNVVLKNVKLGAGTIVKANSLIEETVSGSSCVLGPFARTRPQTTLADNVAIGNFVEIKQANIGAGSKVNHLSYIGDAQIGARVNVGAGTITCNYDGAEKHRTVIENDAFIGSGTQLVAPVTIAQGATIGAGSTITQDAQADALSLSRAKQVTVAGWKRPQKKSQKEKV